MSSAPSFTPSDPAAHARALAVLDPKYDDYSFPLNSVVESPEFLGHTSDAVIQSVKQLRAALEADGYSKRLDTLTMLRFLRARKFVIDDAKAMFVASEKWRTEENIDALPSTFVYEKKDEIFKYYPQFYHKTDKEGRPVYFEQLGKIDLPAMTKIIGGTEEEASQVMQNHLIVEYEKVGDPRLPACSRKHGHLVETCCTIIDAKGVSLFVPASIYSFIKTASDLAQNNYPERLGKLYIINTPWGFSAVWSVIKNFIDPVTASKINIPGSSYILDELKKQIPVENIPKFLGGECQCPGPLGCMGSDAGPWNEAEYKSPAWWEKPAGDVGVASVEPNVTFPAEVTTDDAKLKPDTGLANENTTGAAI